MDALKTWSLRLSFGAALAGAVMSRDACLGGSRPRPDPAPTPTASASAAPDPGATAAATPDPAAPAPSGTFAAPP